MNHDLPSCAIGVVGGTGVYAMDCVEEARWVQVETPFGAPSDEFRVGRIGDRWVAFLPRHGRGHRLLPSELNHRANIYAFKKLGVRWLVSLSAVGSLKEEYPPGTFVLPSQFYDRTKQSRAHTFFGDGIVAHVSFAHPFCSILQETLFRAAQATGPAFRGGTYVCMEGPAFSTLAESEENRRAGFDLIGMTNLGEAKCAREAEISYATVAMVTDYDCWHPTHDSVSLEMVVSCLHKNAERARSLVLEAIPQIPLETVSPAHSALKNAILTAREHWPEATIAKLRPLLAPYLS
jgi:5'-methylthioadenosine phosphorylase